MKSRINTNFIALVFGLDGILREIKLDSYKIYEPKYNHYAN